ncbi:MAG TPA: hypothetical protein VGA61_07000 [Anaerolineae bacterium]
MKDWRGLGLLHQLSWVLGFSVLLPLGFGIGLDWALHKSPLFLIVGAAIGILAGTVSTVRISMRAIDGIALRRLGAADGEEPKEDRAE